MKKIVAYYRNSTDLQENSIHMQQSKALEFASKQLLVIDEEITDVDTSARKIKLESRPGISKIISQIKMGLIQAIIVYKRDRLSRNLEEHLKLYRLFKEYDISVYFTSQNEIHMYYTPIGEYLETILGAMAEHEGKQIAMRILETRIANYIKGNKVGKPPFGYTKTEEEGKQPEILFNEKEIFIVKEIFRTILHDEHPDLSSIYDHLNNKGFKRFKDDGKEIKWDKKKLKTIVNNMMYAGTRIINFGKPIPKKYDKLAIITENEWSRANSIFEEIAEEKGTRNTFRCPILKFLQCKICTDSLFLNKRIVNGEMYRTVECKNCEKVIAFLHQIEEFLHEQLNHYYESLLSTHFKELYERQQRKNVNNIKKLIERGQLKIKTLEKDSINLTEKYLKNELQREKEALISHYEKLKKNKSEIILYYEELVKIESFGEIIQNSNKFYKEVDFSTLLPSEVELFYDEIINRVHIGEHELDIYFKHPFFTAREVYDHEENRIDLKRSAETR